MKKFILFFCTFMVLMSSCANSKSFEKSDGTKFIAETYGILDKDQCKKDSVEYRVSTGNVVWSVLLCETVVVPVWLVGFNLYEPYQYIGQ